MDFRDVPNVLKQFRWDVLKNVYGSAHSTIIGFLSSEWNRLSTENSVLDGAPSPHTGGSREGQKNADIILCMKDRPVIVVEVETTVRKYNEKLASIRKYLGNPEVGGSQFGLLVLSNYTTGPQKYQHNWSNLKVEIRSENAQVALVSIEKIKMPAGDSILSELRARNDYNSWNIEKIEYWTYHNNEEESGHLFPSENQ